jgi:hypothetical protein
MAGQTQQTDTTLAEQFGVKVADAQLLLEDVKIRSYLDEMAKFGHVARDEASLERMVAVGRMAEAAAFKNALKRQDNDQSIFKDASEHLARSLGVDSPEASFSFEAEMDDSLQKTAQFVEDPQVIAHLLALSDAQARQSA